MKLTPDEQAEYDALMAEAIGGDVIDSATAAERVETLLLDAEQAGRRWATEMLADARRAGCQARAKRWKRAHETQLTVTLDDRRVAKARTRGRRRREGAGSAVWQRADIGSFVETDVRDALAECRKRIFGERATIGALQLVLPLFAAAPGAVTVDEACEVLGTCIDDVLDGSWQVA